MVPHINYTITKMEFTSINVRMMFPNMEIVTSSGPASLYIKRGITININKSMNYFEQEHQISFNTP